MLFVSWAGRGESSFFKAMGSALENRIQGVGCLEFFSSHVFKSALSPGEVTDNQTGLVFSLPPSLASEFPKYVVHGVLLPKVHAVSK